MIRFPSNTSMQTSLRPAPYMVRYPNPNMMVSGLAAALALGLMSFGHTGALGQQLPAHEAGKKPVPSMSHLQKANSLAARGNYQTAVVEYKAALEEQPQNANAHHMCGRTLALMGDFPAAIDQYRLAAGLAPKDAELFNDLGVVLSFNGEIGDAIVELRRAVAIDPNFTAAYNNLGSTLIKQGDFQGAVDALRTSLRIQPHNEAVEKKLQQALQQLRSQNQEAQPDATVSPNNLPTFKGSQAKPN